MAEQAAYRDAHGEVQALAAAAHSSGEVIQLVDGRAAVVGGLKSVASGDAEAQLVSGQFDINKSTSVVFLRGQEVFWDDANGQATYKTAGEFFCGIAVEDTTAAATTVRTDLNKRANYIVEYGKTGFIETAVGAAGSMTRANQGGTFVATFDTTTEAQLVDALSEDSIPIADGVIFECEVDLSDNGDDAALDFNVGIASASHATDAESIADFVLVHVDGNALDIFVHSDDGTTDVTLVDSTINCVEDTYFHVVIDARKKADVQVYINGALVLGGSTFSLNAGTGPMKALVHLEKTSNNTPGQVRVKNITMRAARG